MKQQYKIIPMLLLHGLVTGYAFYVTLTCEAFAMFDILGVYILWSMNANRYHMMRMVNELLNSNYTKPKKVSTWIPVIHFCTWCIAQMQDGNTGIVRAARAISSVSMSEYVVEIENVLSQLPSLSMMKESQNVPGAY